MKIALVIPVIFLIAGCTQSQEASTSKEPAPPMPIAFDLKGITIGTPATPGQVLEKLGVTCGIGSDDMQVCNGSVTIARELAELNLVINKAGVVQRMRMTLSPESFDIVASLLIGKFGQPTETERSQVQNRMGARYEQIQHWWRGKDDVNVVYSKYEGTLDLSSLYFSTKEDRDLIEKVDGKSKAERAADI